jgi:hypothetical protein
MNTVGLEEFYNDEGDRICETCFFDHYVSCADCGTVLHIDDATPIEGSESRMCSSCAALYECDDCGRYVDSDQLEYVDGRRRICVSCGMDYYPCDDCGSFVRYNDAHNIDDYWYCSDCAEDHMNAIQAYDYRPPSLHFYGCSVGERVGYGAEIEVDDGENREDAARAILRCAEDFIYLKHDSSLNSGFEIVTHPATLDYHMTEFPWSEILRAAEGYDFKSHDTTTCGLHIHASRALFGSGPIQRDLNIAKCMLLIDAYWDQYIVPFSRRDYAKLTQWARKPDAGITSSDDEHTAIYKAKKSADKGRYQAVNLQNNQTVEFRFFRGTLRRDTIIASLQFLDVLINYAKKTELKDIFNKSFLEVFDNTGYPELTEYLKLRKLIKE